MSAVGVESFGAIDDGITDDTIAFKKAMKSGSDLLITKTYNVPGGVELLSGITLDGAGTGVILSNGKENRGLHGIGLKGVTIKGLTTKIPVSNTRANSYINIQFKDCDDVVVDSCKTVGGVAGMWFVSCNDVVVKNSVVRTPKADGIHFGHGSKRCLAEKNHVINAGDDSFATTYYKGYAGRPSDIKFIDNVVSGSIWGRGVAVYSGDNIEISGNTINGTGTGGIAIVEHQDGGLSKKITVTNNVISNSNTAKVIPYKYWNGGIDKKITSRLHNACFPIKGIDVLVNGNSFSGDVLVVAGGNIRLLNNKAKKVIVDDGIPGVSIKPERKKKSFASKACRIICFWKR